MGSYRDRWQDDIIADIIEKGSTVLDLGCGNGDLLYRLINEKDVKGQGIEISPDSVEMCLKKRVPILQINIKDGVSFYNDNTFDYVILEETLQTLNEPIEGLKEMLRVGKFGIVSFPNFAYKNVGEFLIKNNRMPVTNWLPYQWHNTPNIHLCTLEDLNDWIALNDVKVKAGYGFTNGKVCELDENSKTEAEEILLILEA